MSEPAFTVIDNRAASTLTIRADILDDIETFVRRYVSITGAQAATITIWIAHTWAIEAAECTPYLAVMSKEKRSGKTRALEVCELLVRNPVRTADITEAALFHIVSGSPCTLLIDEIDTVFGGGKSREPLRALLNASYRRGSPVQRVKGGHVQSYDVFGPKMIAGIGELPDTVADRSIFIRMVRKAAGESVSRFNMRDVEGEAATLKARLKNVFAPRQETLSFFRSVVGHRPELPRYLNDRAADSWEPLFALADVIGEGWSEKVRDASKELSVSVDWREAVTEEVGVGLVR